MTRRSPEGAFGAADTIPRTGGPMTVHDEAAQERPGIAAGRRLAAYADEAATTRRERDHLRADLDAARAEIERLRAESRRFEDALRRVLARAQAKGDTEALNVAMAARKD